MFITCQPTGESSSTGPTFLHTHLFLELQMSLTYLFFPTAQTSVSTAARGNTRVGIHISAWSPLSTFLRLLLLIWFHPGHILPRPFWALALAHLAMLSSLRAVLEADSSLATPYHSFRLVFFPLVLGTDRLLSLCFYLFWANHYNRGSAKAG